MCDNLSSKQSMVTKSDGLPLRIPFSGPNESQFESAWVVRHTSQPPDRTLLSPLTSSRPRTFSPPQIPSFPLPISYHVERSHYRNAQRTSRTYIRKSMRLVSEQRSTSRKSTQLQYAITNSRKAISS